MLLLYREINNTGTIQITGNHVLILITNRHLIYILKNIKFYHYALQIQPISAATSTKQSPLLKGHLSLDLSENVI